MQKIISVFGGSSGDVDDLNQYLVRGWVVKNTYPFTQGVHFLIENANPQPDEVYNPNISFPSGVWYKGNIEFNHPTITAGSIVFTKENTVYTVINTTN